MNIKMRTDYSYLFGNLGGGLGSSGGGMSTFLSDYASIKNGSYGRLMKAYYAKDSKTSGSKEVSSIAESKRKSLDTATKKELTQVQKDSDALKESADALFVKGNKSLFVEKDITTKDEVGNEMTTKGYDVNAIYKAVNSFVNDYNTLLSSAGTTDSKRIQNGLTSLTAATSSYSKMLSKVGITVNADKTLSIDEKEFKAADMDKVKDLFNTTGSFAYNVSSKASMINFYASSEASKADTYNFSGSYSNSFSSGNLFSSYM